MSNIHSFIFRSSRISTTTQRPSNNIVLIVRNLANTLQRNGLLGSLVNTLQFALLVPPVASHCQIQVLICPHASLGLDEVVFLCFVYSLAYLQRCCPPQRDCKLQIETVSLYSCFFYPSFKVTVSLQNGGSCESKRGAILRKTLLDNGSPVWTCTYLTHYSSYLT
jgi:hypothetical protein